MRKIYSFMVGAVAMFAAVSCAQELKHDNQLPEGEVVVFEATVDGADTKAYLEVVGEGEEQRTFSRWHNDDKITIHNGTTGFEFATSEADVTNGGATARFSYVGNDFSGEKFMAVYPAGSCTDADVATKTVNVNIPKWQQAEDGSFPKNAAVAVAYTDDNTLKFKNAAALLKFTMNMDDVTHVYFKGNNGETVVGKVEVTINNSKPSVVCLEEEDGKIAECYVYGGTFTKGTTYYMAVAPQIFEGGVELKIKRNVKDSEPEEIVVRSTTNKVETKANTVLNLGEIGGMSYTTAPRVEKIYLKPDVWNDADAWFAAHFFNPIGGTEDVTMTESEEYPGIYEIAVPKGVDKVILCRMNPEVRLFDWDHIWNQTANLEIPVSGDEKNCYHVTAYDGPSVGNWITIEEATKVAPEWSVAGTCNAWDLYATPFVEEGKYLVAKNVAFDAAGQFKIVNNGSDWYKVSDFALNKWGELAGGDPNVSIAAGTYDFYLSDSNLYVTSAGSAEPAAPGMYGAKDNHLYFKPHSNWTQAGARFAIYVFGNSGSAWASMTSIGKNGIYEAAIPSGTWTNVIFCRMNPSASANNWDNKWNQTGDLNIKAGNYYELTGGEWDGVTGKWFTKSEF